VSEHDRAWGNLECEQIASKAYLAFSNDEEGSVESLAQSILDYGERQWRRGMQNEALLWRETDKLNSHRNVVRGQRDWAARTIRRLRRQVRFLKLTANALGAQLESERPASELLREEWMK
jgi:hypothetical protein